MVRSEILEQILNRVVTKTTASVSHYLGKFESFSVSFNSKMGCLQK